MSFYDFSEKKTEVARALKQFCIHTLNSDNIYKGKIDQIIIVPLNKYEFNWTLDKMDGKFLLSYLNLSELYQ